MKSKYLAIALLLTITTPLVAQTINIKFKEIHNQFYGKWPKTITFVQKTNMYRADSLFKSQTWYEASIFPNLFRIDLGDIKDGNAIIYRGDSTYNFRKFQKMKPNVDPNILVYLLGGMYFESLEQVNKKLSIEGFDLSKAHKSNWKGRGIDIIGTTTADTTVSQLWYDSKDHYLVRMIQQKPKMRLECQFENHQKTGKIWHEGSVKIFVQNKLVQTEEYSDFKINVALNPDFFNPDKFGSWHWMKQ
ncbi:hypothetical protein FA048_16715 [Pedobacter polaris]|uniref:Outer membrane lipoprotein-sorting protein n=1 Tax=Pedobacter polaris TaxID=2571273 RepID=A0A4U1CFX0_9SPHI|nr:hypothetical protein [Pedobacter polaris]TKC05371.1 hypothetical protein FA048_16715 [Pedobacter polaris]